MKMSKQGYPLWWDTTVTIYNKAEDPQTNIVTWYRTVLPDCFWKYAGNQVTIGEVVLDTKSILCRIPKDSRFLERHEWLSLPNDQKGNFFTVGQGDIIVKGEVTEEINEYESGHRSTDFLAKYRMLQGCMEVREFAINAGAGRNNEHYFVRGL